MMTDFFLAYVAERLMGPPTGESGGKILYPCPRCDSLTAFAILAHKVGFKDRFKCLRCGFWGDEIDLVKLLSTDGNHWETLGDLRNDFERGVTPSYSLSGVGGARPRVPTEDALKWSTDGYSDEGDAAVDALLAIVEPDDRSAAGKTRLAEALTFATTVLSLVGEHGIHPAALADRLSAAAHWAEQDAEHMAECDDPRCDYYCCRIARGWTPEMIKADLERARRKRKVHHG